MITVHFKAKKEFRNQLLELCRGMLEPSRKEEGCLSYTLYQDVTDENSFFFFEEWKDQSAIDRHVQTTHYKEFVPRFKKMIDGEDILKVRAVE
ncbi:MAG: antibiotic biosynthesis monooxygenase [Bacteroidetes bacterium]|nr:antibiotic biosynthesis monooxygenase [Bacteroidota bacterium]